MRIVIASSLPDVVSAQSRNAVPMRTPLKPSSKASRNAAAIRSPGRAPAGAGRSDRGRTSGRGLPARGAVETARTWVARYLGRTVPVAMAS